MKIGAIKYYNTLPLIYSLNCPVQETPKLLVDAFEKSTCNIDIALLPILYVIKNKNLNIYPEVGIIACDGPVTSVILFTKPSIKHLGDIQSIFFDQDSLTSNVLMGIILHKFYGLTLDTCRIGKTKSIDQADACLLIGDRALFPPKVLTSYRAWDVGSEWKKHTGMGFIFACWASKRKLNSKELYALAESKRNGINNIDRIVRNLKPTKQKRVRQYLEHSIKYELTSNIEEGYRVFKNLVSELQLCE
jgi:chorismate dehydratase